MATAAAAVLAEAKHEIQHQFFAADAVRADRAVPFQPSGRAQTQQFSAMQKAGIIRAADDNRYWFDMVAYDDALQRKRRTAKMVLIVASIVLVVELIAFGMLAQ